MEELKEVGNHVIFNCIQLENCQIRLLVIRGTGENEDEWEFILL